VQSLQDQARSARPATAAAAIRSVFPLLVGIGLALFLQLVVKPNIGDYPAKLALDIGVAISLAVSLTMVNGFTGQFSMGHAGFMAIGGYASGVVSYYGSLRIWGLNTTHGGLLSGRPMSVDPGSLPLIATGDLLFLTALLVGGLIAAVTGLIVGLPSLRLRGDYLAIVTLGFGEIVRVMIQQTSEVKKAEIVPLASDSPFAGQLVYTWKDRGQQVVAPIHDTWWLSDIHHVGGSLGFTGIPKYTSMFWVYAVAAVTIFVAYRLKRSTYGRAFLSIREDEIASEAMGVNTTRYKVWAFVLSAFFAGVAGALFAHTLGVGLSAETAGFQKSFDIIIMVVLGGLGSISGAVIAAIVVTFLPEALRDIPEYRLIIYALALILLMIFRPKGLFGVYEIWDRATWQWLPWLRRGRANFTEKKA